MPLAANLQRRVAVYHWRRRLSSSWALAIGRSHLSMSLRTHEPGPARFLAGQLDASAETVFMMGYEQGVTGEQLMTFFQGVLTSAQEKYALIGLLPVSWTRS